MYTITFFENAKKSVIKVSDLDTVLYLFDIWANKYYHRRIDIPNILDGIRTANFDTGCSIECDQMINQHRHKIVISKEVANMRDNDVVDNITQQLNNMAARVWDSVKKTDETAISLSVAQIEILEKKYCLQKGWLFNHLTYLIGTDYVTISHMLTFEMAGMRLKKALMKLFGLKSIALVNTYASNKQIKFRDVLQALINLAEEAKTFSGVARGISEETAAKLADQFKQLAIDDFITVIEISNISNAYGIDLNELQHILNSMKGKVIRLYDLEQLALRGLPIYATLSEMQSTSTASMVVKVHAGLMVYSDLIPALKKIAKDAKNKMDEAVNFETTIAKIIEQQKENEKELDEYKKIFAKKEKLTPAMIDELLKKYSRLEKSDLKAVKEWSEKIFSLANYKFYQNAGLPLFLELKELKKAYGQNELLNLIHDGLITFRDVELCLIQIANRIPVEAAEEAKLTCEAVDKICKVYPIHYRELSQMLIDLRVKPITGRVIDNFGAYNIELFKWLKEEKRLSDHAMIRKIKRGDVTYNDLINALNLMASKIN